MVEGDQESGGGGVGVGDPVGVDRVVGHGEQGVPEPGAVVPRIADHGASVLVDGGCRAGQREQGGFEQGAVLGRAAASDPDSSGAVVADGEVAVEVGGSFLTLQGGLEPAVHGVGVDDLGEVSPGPGEVGGVQGPGLAEQDLLPAASDPVTGREVLHGTDDDLGLRR